jgi:hypothetical protein
MHAAGMVDLTNEIGFRPISELGAGYRLEPSRANPSFIIKRWADAIGGKIDGKIRLQLWLHPALANRARDSFWNRSNASLQNPIPSSMTQNRREATCSGEKVVEGDEKPRGARGSRT